MARMMKVRLYTKDDDKICRTDVTVEFDEPAYEILCRTGTVSVAKPIIPLSMFNKHADESNFTRYEALYALTKSGYEAIAGVIKV